MFDYYCGNQIRIIALTKKKGAKGKIYTFYNKIYNLDNTVDVSAVYDVEGLIGNTLEELLGKRT